MIVVNFSHPLSDAQKRDIESLTGWAIEAVLDVSCQIDHEMAFAPQIRTLVDSVPISADEWQSAPILVNLPGLHNAAALVVAELHGRMGHFPSCVRLRPVVGSVPTRFEVAEVINLETVRQESRTRRFVNEPSN
ncbi:MAG: CRISPR-associated protein Csx15 [Bacteroidota bacterium]